MSHAPAANTFTRVLWQAWPWVTWLLPAALILMRMGGEEGGWETVMLIVTAPVTIPAIGLLGSLPRFLLRRKGHAEVPLPIAVMLVVQWWGLILCSLALEVVGDSGSYPSAMSHMFHLTGGVSWAVSTLSLLMWAVLFVATIFVAAVIARKATKATKGVANRQKHSRLPLIALALTPALILTGGVIASEVERSRVIRSEDHAGLTGTEAQQITDAHTARTLENEHWESLQEELGGLRAEVSGASWIPEVSNVVWPVEVSEITEKQYRLESTWLLYTVEDRSEVMERALAWLEAQGWAVEHRFTTQRLVRGTTPSGGSFKFGAREAGTDEAPYTLVTLFGSSGLFWQTGYGEVPVTDVGRDTALEIAVTDKLIRQDDFTHIIDAVQDPAGPLLTFDGDAWPSLNVMKQAWENR